MTALKYVGFSAVPFRVILAPFSDDPDWEDPSVPEPVDQCFLMRYGSFIPARAVLEFAFLAGDGSELLGGTADIYEFHVTPPAGFEGGTLQRGVVRKGATVVGASLATTWVMSIVGPLSHGVRLSSITFPAGAVRLVISVMQLPLR